ncbi:amidohydrolase family protein [Pigmentiphaga litoralis]|uniref:amidohydrolase family protein n=1 Tax=Pigmentiphaga litoralis TaxID=516702 RepID=UPI003B43531E
MHVIGPADAYLMVPDRHYTPGLASHEDLLAHMARNGLSRAVIIQPSVYGTDNRCTLDSVRRLGDAGRAVAVVDDHIDLAGLKDLHAAGVRGLRVNVESAGARDPQRIVDALVHWTGQVAPLGWHVQVYASLTALAAAIPLLPSLPAPIVLDHFAMVPAGTPLSALDVTTVLGLVRDGRAYIKLSAAYRIMPVDPSEGDATAVARLAAAFIGANAERVLWGSDWPHTNREPGKGPLEVSAYRKIDGLVEAALAWMPDAAIRQRVLVDNPARLYQF